MSFDAVIFDFDYTLADGTDAIVECYNYALGLHGRPPAEREAVRRTVGMTVRDSFRALSDVADDSEVEELRLLFRKRADEVLAQGTHLYPDCIDFLTYLKSRGLMTAIVSSKERFRIDEILARDGAEGLVGPVIGVSDAPEPKPSPSGLLKAADMLNAKDILYIGDSLIDAETAAAAEAAGRRVSFAAVTTGTTTREDFTKYCEASRQSVFGVFEDLTGIIQAFEMKVPAE